MQTEESKMYDSVSTLDTTQVNTTIDGQAPTATPAKAIESVYLLNYDFAGRSSSLYQTLKSAEGSTSFSFPYMLSNFSLQPISTEKGLELGLLNDESSAFGALGEIIQAKLTSVGETDYSGSKLSDIANGLKQRGEIRETSEEGYKYLYKVAELEDGPILVLSKVNNIFSNEKKLQVGEELLKSDGRSLVEEYYRFLNETFGESAGFAGLNYLRKGFEQTILDGSFLKSLCDNYMETLPPNEGLTYTFEKGSTDKLDFDVEIERYHGTNLFQVAELLPSTGNFDWNHSRDFTTFHNKTM